MFVVAIFSLLPGCGIGSLSGRISGQVKLNDPEIDFDRIPYGPVQGLQAADLTINSVEQGL